MRYVPASLFFDKTPALFECTFHRIGLSLHNAIIFCISMSLKSKIQSLKVPFIWYVFSVVCVACLFLSYWNYASVGAASGVAGFIYYIVSCISLAVGFTLPVFLLPALFRLFGWQKVGNVLQVLLTGFLFLLVVVNGFVYAQYRLHINSMVLQMVLKAGSDIFAFDVMLYVRTFVGLLLAFAFAYALLKLAQWTDRKGWTVLKPFLCVSLLSLLGANLFHIYAKANMLPACRLNALLPYYYPLSANKLMAKMGLSLAKEDAFKAARHSGVLNYPKAPLVVDSAKATRQNVLLIAIDTWNYRAFTPECVPNITKFAENACVFTHHLSGSEGTRGGVFSLFTGLVPSYYDDFLYSGQQPLLVEQFLAEGYNTKVLASATLEYPEFSSILFAKIPNLRVSTPGITSYDRDHRITDDFLLSLDTLAASKDPFFAFLFYDMAHSPEIPEPCTHRFTPSWKFADYMKLGPDFDPTPYWNLYRNTLFQVDLLIGRVLDRLKVKGLLENTVVVITSDHSQEFNDNKKNYWGHGSNFSNAQIHVPFILYQPKLQPRVVDYRTNHYDLVPTLMHDVLGVVNPTSDYSFGRLLNDSTDRGWHLAADYYGFAFVLPDGTIVQKNMSGDMVFYDAHMNELYNYPLNFEELNRQLLNMNSFYK